MQFLFHAIYQLFDTKITATVEEYSLSKAMDFIDFLSIYE